MNEQRDYPIEQATVPIRICFREEQRTFDSATKSGTAFYLTRNNATYLVTNWHNVTGRDPQTDELIGGSDYVPRHLIVRDWVCENDYIVPLYDNQYNKRWIEIPEPIPFERKTKHRIDVVLIPFSMGVEPILFNSVYQPIAQRLEPSQDVLVLGYPYERQRCIWKTAHIAESVQPWQPYYLINGRTKSGMSGSPVFSKDHAVHMGRMTVNVLIGIYSGRIADLQKGVRETLNELDIGVVWKLDVIDRMIPLIHGREFK